MADLVDVLVPDIGDFTDVPIIEVLVSAGDVVAAEDPLITLESDKATMDVPAPQEGTVSELVVDVGDTVSEGSVILKLEPAEAAAEGGEGETPAPTAGAAEADAAEPGGGGSGGGDGGAAQESPAPTAASGGDEKPSEQLDEQATSQPQESEPPSYGSESGVYESVEVHVPDIGDFTDVPVIEVLVSPGDTVQAEDPLITLESDKATMDVPSPAEGTVKELKLSVGDTVSEGALILMLDTAASNGSGPKAASPTSDETTAPEPTEPTGTFEGETDIQAQVVVLGAGPGGYTAAFRAADLGLKTVIVERYESLGGVCLNVGCIPSKALLHMAKVIVEAEESAAHGLSFGEPEIDVEAMRGWKDGVVDKLTGGLTGLAKQRKIETVTGVASFESPNVLSVETGDGTTTIGFENCIIAAGSRVFEVPGFPLDDPRIMDSTGALKLEDVPERLLVVGGGIIGLEMATVYDALGSEVTVVEMMDALIPGADKDLVRPLQKRIEKRYASILLKTKVAEVEPTDEGLKVTFEGDKAPEPQVFDRILMATGRRPNGGLLGAEKAGVAVDDRGFISVDSQQRTNVAHIHAIGDVVGEPMLAHKATHEGKIAAEVIAGHDVSFDARTIPSVAYTDPEVAWMGLTENQAKAEGIEVEKGAFPWAASGRSLAMGRDEGLTKALFEPGTRRLLGAGIVGPNAGELIAEAVHALEMGSNAEDIGLTVHAHPTLSETLAFAAEMAEGTITDLMPPRKRAPKKAEAVS